MTEAPEPEDKLDATATVVVNGPEDATLAWHQTDWRQAEASVRRLRQRIFTTSQAGDLSRVRSLQKLMLRSRANTLASVRRVTERNAGRLTAGVDGEVVLTPEAKMQLAERVQQGAEPFKALPVRRVYIPKPGSAKRRALGIPVISTGAIRHGSSTRWSPSGRRGLSRGPMDFGRAAVAMTRSLRST
jgi:RNA-directed DNA polymerase